MYSNRWIIWYIRRWYGGGEAMQSNVVKTVEMGHVVVLNRVIGVDLSGTAAFQQKFERVKWGAMCTSGWSTDVLWPRCKALCKGPETEVVPALWQQWLEQREQRLEVWKERSNWKGQQTGHAKHFRSFSLLDSECRGSHCRVLIGIMTYLS